MIVELIEKIILCVNDERSSLSNLERTLQHNVTCKLLSVNKPYASTCFGHVMSKTCQYAVNNITKCEGCLRSH